MTGRMLAGLCCIFLLGCGQTETPAPRKPKPLSYAEALTIYNQEVALLGQLKAQAATAQTAHEERLSRLKTAQALGTLGEAIDLNAVTELATSGNLLDDEATAKAKAASEKAKSQLSDASTKAKAEMETAVKEYEARMAELNKSIQEQEEKVAKAKQ